MSSTEKQMTEDRQAETLRSGDLFGVWSSIESAPIDSGERDGDHQFGPWLLMYPVHGEVARARFWRKRERSNWISDYGFAVHPTHWMPLPPQPNSKR